MSTQPHPDRVRLLPWRIPTWVVDGVFVLLALTDTFSADHPIKWIAMVVAIAVIIGRRRYPLAAVVVALAMTAVVVTTGHGPSMIMLAVLVALFNVGVSYPWRVALGVGAAAAIAFGGVVFGWAGDNGREEAGLAAFAWPAFATAAGAAVRASRENLAAAHDRAARAEATRELEAGRRVTEERLRIARDVHDLVAHHIAVVNVQSGVAGHVLRSDPDAAETALTTIRESASTAVDELGQLLSVLRSTDEESDGAAGGATDGPVAPTPDLAAIDDLISSFAASGMRIEREISGTPRPLSASAQVAAYRVVQEALTNAHKHGDGGVTIARHFSDDGLAIIVTNPVARPAVAGSGANPDAGSGYGLVGMRERLDAVGGELSIADSGASPAAAANTFTLRAHIPSAGAE